jgi:hypothetical protein
MYIYKYLFKYLSKYIYIYTPEDVSGRQARGLVAQWIEDLHLN